MGDLEWRGDQPPELLLSCRTNDATRTTCKAHAKHSTLYESVHSNGFPWQGKANDMVAGSFGHSDVFIYWIWTETIPRFRATQQVCACTATRSLCVVSSRLYAEISGDGGVAMSSSRSRLESAE